METARERSAGHTSGMPSEVPECAAFLHPVRRDYGFPPSAGLPDLTGAWLTELCIFSKRVHLCFHIEITAEQIRSHFDCPEAGLLQIPVQETSLHRDVVRFDMDDFDAGFSGILNPDLQQIEGIFRHGGFRFPATFTRTE